MYQLINTSTGKSELLTEREAIAKYGEDKVNTMMFGLDPDMTLTDTVGDDIVADDDFSFVY